MKRTTIQLLHTILLLMACCLLQAQEVDEFTFSHIGQADGMHSQRIYSILQTNDGALWWSSKQGVERYNGVSIKHYSLGGPNVYSDAGKRIELCDHFGKDVKAPEPSDLLVYDNKGCIYAYDAVLDQYRLVANIGSMMKGQVDLTDIMKTDKGFWLATNKGIFFLHDGKLIPVASNYHANYIVRTNKSLLFCTRQGVLEYRHDFQALPQADTKLMTIVPYDVESGFYDPIYNKVWLGGYASGVRILSEDASAANGYQETVIGLSHYPVRAFYPYDMHTMLVGIDGQGVYKVSRQAQSGSHTSRLLFNANEGSHGMLNGNGIYTLIRDIWGNIVMGSYSGGIDIARPVGTTVAVFQHIAHNAQSILNDHVNCIIQSKSGLLMMGTDNGISIYNPKTQSMTHACRGCVVLDLKETPHGTILAATYGQGVLEFTENGASKPLYTKDNNILKDDHVFRLFYDHDGSLWVGCLDGNLVHLTANAPQYYPINFVKDMLELADGRMVVGTTFGIFIIHPDTGKTEKLNYGGDKEKEVNPFVHVLYLDNDHELWIGTDGGGIYVYNTETGKSRHLSMENGLTSNFVNGIGKDSFGRIIITTERGLSFVDPKDANHIIGVNYCYGVDREYTSRSIANLDNGHIALGSTTGALVVDPNHIQAINYSAKLNLLTVHIDEDTDDDFKKQVHRQLARHELSLTYGQRTFELLFEAINLRNQSDIVYRYKVDDSEWSKPSDQQYIRFTSMESGEHQLKVRCISRTCGALLDEAKLTICIGQPWWNSWWMWLIYILLVALAFYGSMRVYQLHTKYMRLVVNNLKIETGLPTTPESPEEPNNQEASATANKEDNEFISQATKLVIDNIADSDFTIDRLCREMAMSRTLFYVKLKSYTGKSPQDFIRVIRLERAAALLRSGKQVTDAAALSGFDNPKYFSTVFKKYFGVSPSKYQ